MKTVIMAGGRGTRIASVRSDIPKPMIKIEGKPVLEHELECLRAQGLLDIIITVGHLGSSIMDYFGDGTNISPATGKPFGVHIEYYIEKEALGTAGALFQIKDKLTEDFLLLNADVVFDIDFNRFIKYHRERGGLVTLFTHPNTHPYDSGLIIADENNVVRGWITSEEKRPQWYQNRVNAGLHILSPKVLDKEPKESRIDLDRQVLKPLIGTGRVVCYDSPEYVRDMGTPKRYEEVCSDFQKGYVKAKNLQNRQEAVFFDRDGTLNKYVGFLHDVNDFELLPGAAEIIRRVNESGKLAIVVTNQPVIARGELTMEGLREIHNKMETLLGEKGGYLDGIYFCPHHPHGGYKGEVPELKKPCECRKPEPGMLLRAAEDFNIDLSSSWMIGDSRNDIEAGKAAGCRTILIGTGEYGEDRAIRSLSSLALAPGLKRHMDSLLRRYPVLEGISGDITDAYLVLEECYQNGGKLLIAGNGGSAADSEHMAGELMKCFRMPRPVSSEFAEKLTHADPVLGKSLAEELECPLTVVPLAAHEALSTACLNDIGGSCGFAQQLFGFGRRGDVFLGISTSGNSENIIRASVTARAMGIKVIGLTGANGGRLAKAADISIKVPASETYLIQELHLPIYHCLCMMLEDKFFGSHQNRDEAVYLKGRK